MRRCTCVAGEAVLSNPDLVAHILMGTIGPSTYFAASLVSKAWHAACRADETLLRLVALYQGGLTRTLFRRLFVLSHDEVKALPHAGPRARGCSSPRSRWGRTRSHCTPIELP